MLRGFLAFCILLPVHCSRQSSYSYAQILAESSSVPKVIYDALREAGALVQTHLETLQEAERLAEQRQADSSARIDEKTQAMKAMQTQMDFVATKAKATRDLMLQVDTAAAKHSKAGEDHQKSITEFGKASDALEEMAKKVTLKEQKLRDIFGDYKRELGDLKSQWDKMSQERDQAEAEMKDLKTQAMSAGKFKTSVQEEQAKVERDMQLAQQELQGMRRELETAVSAATVAEAQEAQAVNEAREADGRVEVAKKTRAYLMKIRRAVQAYYGSIDELESAVDGKANVELKEVPEAKMVLEKYNLMLSAFGDLHAYDAEVYEKVTAAKEEVKNNAFAQLRFICDMLGISTSEEGHCLTGLWKTFGMAKLQFPDEEVEKAPEAPEEIEDVIPDEPLEELEEEEDDDMDIETPQEPEAKHDAMDIETPQELEAKHDDMDIETPQEPEEEDDDMDIDTPQEPEARHDAMDIETPQELEAKHDAMDIETPQEPEEEDDDMDMETPQEPEEEDDDMDIESEPANDATQRLGKRRSDVPPASPAKNRKRKRVADETLPDLPLPAPKRFKRSAPEPEEPPFVQEVSKVSLKNRKRKRSELEYDPLAHQRVTDEPLPDLPLPAPKRFKRSALEPEEPPFVQEVPKASPAKNRKRKRVTDEPLPDLPLPAPKRFKRSAPEPEEPPFVQEVPKASPATNLKRKRSPENDPLAFQRVTDEPLPDLPLPAPKRFKRSAPEPEEPPFVQEVPKASPATNLKRKRLLENDPLAFQRVTDEPLPDLPLPAPNSFKRSAPEPEEPPLMQEVPKAPMSTAAPVTAAAIECGGAQVHWASCSKRDGCRYVKKADVSRCGVSQHGCYDESQLLSECQLSLAPAPPSGCGGGGVHFASCYKKSGCRYVKKEDVTLCGVSLYGCYAVKELPLACQPQVRGVRVRLS